MPAPALLMKMLPMMMGQSGGQGGGGGMQGAGLPMAIGGAQLIQGHIQRAKAKKMQPAQEDAQQVTAMQEYQRRANNAMTGANISNQMRDLAQMQGAGVKALSRGGNLGQYAQLGRIQGNALNNILAQGQAQEQSYRTMFNDMLNTVADRRMRVQSKAADAMSMRSEKNIGAGTQGIMAGMAKMGGGKSTNTGAEIGTKGTSGSSFGPQSMNMEQITAAGNAPIMGFGGMPLGI
jgi:hypothetical protein